MTKPGFGLIHGHNTPNELGIVLDFGTKEITLADISPPMSDINKLKRRATIEMAWKMNNSFYQSMSKEAQSMLKATKHFIQILDAKYEKVNLRETIKDDCSKHLSAPESIVTGAPARV